MLVKRFLIFSFSFLLSDFHSFNEYTFTVNNYLFFFDLQAFDGKKYLSDFILLMNKNSSIL